MSTRTITSPGVEIFEQDLSLVAPPNVGTNIFITGYTSQGPIDEVIKITSDQELDQIYGTPTNSAERYFYYSVREILNSSANVYTSRLPYGVDLGEGFGAKYSALLYPVKVVTGGAGTEVASISSYGVEIEFTGPTAGYALSGAQLILQTSTGAVSTLGFDIDSDGSASVGDDAAIEITSGGSISSIRSELSAGLAAVFGAAEVTYTLNSFNISLSGFVPLTEAGTVTPSIYPGFEEAGDTFTVTSTLSTIADSDQVLGDDMDQPEDAVYILGEPVHLDLTEAEYKAAVEGSAFDWSNTAYKANAMTSIDDGGHAGVIILNKSQSTVNAQFEGYYIGIADNTNINPASAFDAIKHAKTLSESATSTTGSNFLEIPAGTLQFHLSANAPYGPSNSVSEIMENLTDYNIDGREDDDVLSVGEFKLRKSIYATEAFKLDYVLEAGAVGSINEYRHQTNPKGGPTIPFSIETKDSTSRNMEILVNPYISNRYEGTDGLDISGLPNKKIRVYTEQLVNNTSTSQTGIATEIIAELELEDDFNYADSLYPLGSYSSAKSSTKVLGNVPSKISRALRGVENDEVYDIDIVVEGGLGTIYSMAEAAGTAYYDEYEVNGISSAISGIRTSNDVTNGASVTLLQNYRTVFNIFEQFCSPPHVGGGRGDCIFIADPFRQIFVTGKQNKIGDDKSRSFQTDTYWAIRHQFENENTSYAANYGNWANVYDTYSGKNVWVPFSGFGAAAMARTDSATFPWYAPAGFTRGLVQFANDIALTPNQKQRDELYKANINPVAFFPGQGNVIYGQKTLSRKPSAFDRINVRRLFLALERPTKKACRFFVFEPNTEFTRTRLKNTLIPIFENAKNNEGIYDYIIVCDERNNTPEVIDNNELVVDIYIKAVRTAEYIRVNFIATRTDANFEELING